MDSTPKHVDWDGLVYYDGKIKSYIEDTLTTSTTELNDKLDSEADRLHDQLSDVETRVTIHDQDLRKLVDEIGKIDSDEMKQEITTHVIDHFDDTIETTVSDKLDTIVDSDNFNTIIIEKIEEFAGTTDGLSYGTF